MDLKHFIYEMRHLATRLIIVDPEGHEVYEGKVGHYVHWAKRALYDNIDIEYIVPEDSDLFIIFLQGGL